jgi:hypothetical protein
MAVETARKPRVHADTSVFGGCFDREFTHPHFPASGGDLTVRKSKEFDCVRMKREIQEKLRKEFEGMTAEEAREARRRRIAEHSVIGPFAEQVRITKTRTTQ